MFWHLFQLVFRPRRHSMNIAVLVAHEIKVAQRDGYWLGADSEKSANIDDGLAACSAMDVIDLSNLMVICAIYGCTFQNFWGQLCS
ncbi:hypothetical protein ASF69_21115 [Rhizobium sp. Leaf311]|nr:hypothetical protein ASF69_21115 [Rhizobium sp. Leaf311]